jgi:signal transduction histidine kinase
MKDSNQRRVAVAGVTTVMAIVAALTFTILGQQRAAIVAAVLAIACSGHVTICAVSMVGRLRARNEELRRLDQLKDDFVASVSHELRTPLTSIRGYLELVLDGDVAELTEEQLRYLSVVDRNAGRLLRVVDDLLFAAQVDAGKVALEPGLTDLDELVREAVEAARPVAAEHDVELTFDADGPAELVGDRARLAQILDNLIANAIKFTPPGGKVEVRTFLAGDSGVVEVADTGIGISAEDQERLFQRFFRAEGAILGAIDGAGLGLAIVKAIVDAHGGDLAVESIAGRGTTFRIGLPLERVRVAA